MIYPAIRIEGAILSPDILDRLKDATGRRLADFGLVSGVKVSKKSQEEAEAGYYGLLELRRLHRELEHGFHEVETLPKNDCYCYTISPAARKEVLKRLLALNHQRAAAEAVTVASIPVKTKRGRKVKGDDSQGSLF